MDEISSSPAVRAMFQAATDVVDAGYRLLRSPGAEKKLEGNYAVLQATLQNLEAALAKHPLAAQTRPQAFAPSPASTPASFRRSPVLGVAIADDVVILVIILAAAAIVAVSAGQAGKPPPKITRQDIFEPLEHILALAVGLSAAEATKLRELIKDIIEKIKECMDKHPERLVACADFITKPIPPGHDVDMHSAHAPGKLRRTSSVAGSGCSREPGNVWRRRQMRRNRTRPSSLVF